MLSRIGTKTKPIRSQNEPKRTQFKPILCKNEPKTNPILNGRSQKSEDRGQRAEDRRQKTEDRRQKTEDRRQEADDGERNTIFYPREATEESFAATAGSKDVASLQAGLSAV